MEEKNILLGLIGSVFILSLYRFTLNNSDKIKRKNFNNLHMLLVTGAYTFSLYNFYKNNRGNYYIIFIVFLFLYGVGDYYLTNKSIETNDENPSISKPGLLGTTKISKQMISISSLVLNGIFIYLIVNLDKYKNISLDNWLKY